MLLSCFPLEEVLSVRRNFFDTLNDFEGGRLNRTSRFRELMTSDTLFFTSHAGEHYMQTRVMLAMLNNLQAKNKDGKVIDQRASHLTTWRT